MLRAVHDTALSVSEIQCAKKSLGELLKIHGFHGCIPEKMRPFL